MGYSIDKDAVKHAGGTAYSKYGYVRNSKDLKVPEEELKWMDRRVQEWIKKDASKTVALERGDVTVWEEFLENYPMDYDVIPLLRICKMMDKNSEMYKEKMGILYDRHAIPWCKGIDRYLINVNAREMNSRRLAYLKEHPEERQLAIWANAAEEKCDKQRILEILMGKSKIAPGAYLSPWKARYLNPKGDPWEDMLHTYPSEVRSRILEMYLDIADMDEVSPKNKWEIRYWAARKLLEQPYLYDKVKGCCVFRDLGQDNEKVKTTYIRILTDFTWSREEDSFLVMKRLDSYDIPEAPYYLGIKYLEGLGCERDYQEARRCFVKGKGQGPEEYIEKCSGMVSYATRKADSYESFKIAMKKLESEQFEDGIKRLEKLADEEDLEEAQYKLAKLLEIGYKIKKDEERALEYYKKAAESGNREAMEKVMKKLEKEYDRMILREGYHYTKEKMREEISKWKCRLEKPYQKDYKTK